MDMHTPSVNRQTAWIVPLLAAGFSVFSLSCEDPVEPAGEHVTFATDHERYALNDSIKFRVTNGYGDTIGYQSCGHVLPLERFTNGEWQWLLTGNDICSYIVLRPDEARLHHLPFVYPTLEAGKYRFRLRYSTSTSSRPDLGDPVQSWTLYSNEFWIDDITFRAKKTGYWAGESITTVISNPLRRPIIVSCAGPWIQQLAGGIWQNVPDAWGCKASIDGDTLAQNQKVSASFEPLGGLQSGTYRLRIAYYPIPFAGGLVETHSEPFEIWQ
jgi:hypothetical protein